MTTSLRMLAAAGGLALALGLAACSSPATTATPARPGAHRGGRDRVSGVVVADSAGRLTLRERSGATRTFTVTAATRILRGKAPVGQAALAVGERVRVLTRATSPATAVRVRVLAPGASPTSPTRSASPAG